MDELVDGPWPTWPRYDDEQVDAAARVLASGRVNYWTGDEGRAFEREFADLVGLRHAVFVANGTVGLEAALEALGLPPGSEVVTTPRTFVATSFAILRTGGTPVFADVDEDSGAITAASIAAVLTPRSRAVVVVHVGGWPADMPSIRALCDERGLALVEDCAQAHGAMIDGRHVGAWGDISVWSFCQDKIITTGGEGGMVATDDERLWRSVWSLKDHGKSWEAVYEHAHPPGFRWLHESVGTNFRGTEVQAAIGRIQLRRLPSWHAARTGNAHALAGALSGIDGLRVPLPADGITHAYYRLYALLDPEAFTWTRDQIIDEVSQRLPLPVLSGSCSEIYREVAFAGTTSVPAAPLPVAHELTRSTVAFLVHPGLTGEHMARTAETFAEVLEKARG